ncbi:MAG: hypothetical protein J7K61_00955 [Thermoplasmata archaeon]|nr:hypothetical protein [Thermoplasmata archaeon]
MKIKRWLVMILIIYLLAAASGNNIQKKVERKSIWIWGATLYDVGADSFVNEMISHNFSDVYLLIKDTSGYYTFTLLDELLKASSGKIRINAWIICFYDESAGGWVDVNSSYYRNYLINDIIVPAVERGADGICLDYIRYPGNAGGNTYPITTFCRDVRNVVKSMNPHCTLSAAVMPEMEANAYYYGQDYSQMGKYVDILLPMTYTHAYKMPPSWVGEVVSYIKERTACKVDAIIETLDENGNFMDDEEIKECVEDALNNGSDGISLFRYPVARWQYDIIDEYNPFLDTIPPNVSILLPEKNCIYIFGKAVMHYTGTTIIIGYPREVAVNASDNEGIKKLEFYEDGNLIYEKDSYPYIFPLEYRGYHRIEVIGYDDSGNVASDKMEIYLFYVR